jgi:hypothetical protein
MKEKESDQHKATAALKKANKAYKEGTGTFRLIIHMSQPTVPVQRELERERSPLVSNSALRAGIFKASGSIDPMRFGKSAKGELPRP